MSLFRGDRVLSNILRHDPFSPFARPSLSPFYSPFFTVLDEPRSSYYEHQQPQQQTITQGSNKPSPSHKAESISQPQASPQGSREVACTSNTDDSQVERRHRRHHSRHSEAFQHPLSVFGGSPFTGSAWPSLFNSALSPFTPLTAAVQAIPDITVDVHSTPQAYSIRAAVPGMNKNDIQVTVDDGVLTIEAERKESRSRQPANSSGANTNAGSSSTATSGVSASPSSAASPTPSTAGAQPAAEMKSQESKEEMKEEEKTAALSTTVESTSASNATATTNGASAMEEDPSDSDFHYTETYYRRVQRSIQLPEDARVDDLTAKYENGVLHIDIPRVQEQKKTGRRIEIQ